MINISKRQVFKGFLLITLLFSSIEPFRILDCDLGCIRCSFSGECESCHHGYRLSPFEKKCIPCAISGCFSCDKHESKCDYCSPGYMTLTNQEERGFDTDFNKLDVKRKEKGVMVCLPCIEDCVKCFSKDKCSQCKQDYSPNEDGTLCIRTFWSRVWSVLKVFFFIVFLTVLVLIIVGSAA